MHCTRGRSRSYETSRTVEPFPSSMLRSLPEFETHAIRLFFIYAPRNYSAEAWGQAKKATARPWSFPSCKRTWLQQRRVCLSCKQVSFIYEDVCEHDRLRVSGRSHECLSHFLFRITDRVSKHGRQGLETPSAMCLARNRSVFGL